MAEIAEPELGRPSRDLTGRVAIVTGAGAFKDYIGNARAASILLAEDGCSIVCVDLKLELAQRTVEMIEAEGKGKAIAVQANILVAEDCQKVVKAAIDTFGRVDILFNCVGIGGPPGDAVAVDMEAFAKGMEVNVSSMVLMTKYVVPEMKKNQLKEGCRGAITNMGSVAGIRGGNPALLYPTSKGAVVSMTKAMAFHHAPDGIRVNCICPGLMYTPLLFARGMPPEVREARKNRSLLKIEGNGWDVGATVRFLSGDDARFITGLIMEVDAGATVAVGTELAPNTSITG